MSLVDQLLPVGAARRCVLKFDYCLTPVRRYVRGTVATHCPTIRSTLNVSSSAAKCHGWVNPCPILLPVLSFPSLLARSTLLEHVLNRTVSIRILFNVDVPTTHTTCLSESVSRAVSVSSVTALCPYTYGLCSAPRSARRAEARRCSRNYQKTHTTVQNTEVTKTHAQRTYTTAVPHILVTF